MKKIKYLYPIIFAVYISASIAEPNTATTNTAIFAGGCFWSMQHDFEKLKGIIKTTVGYTGSAVVNPTYKQVSTGKTGHYEAIQIIYDPTKITYQELLNFYWHDIDPTNASGQFCDIGSEYRPVIFYMNDEQKTLAINSKQQLIDNKQFKEVATKILPAMPFYPAEEYHQHYSDKNPVAYNFYRVGCGRDSTLNSVWGTK